MENNINLSKVTNQGNAEKKRRILIIESNDVLANYISCIVDPYGYIDNAKNGRDALVYLSYTKYDAIVFDIGIPEVSGIDFFRDAIEVDPDIKKKLLFLMSGTYTKQIKFMRDNRVRFLRRTLQAEELTKALEDLFFNSGACIQALDQSA